jgi:hypothetical protein
MSPHDSSVRWWQVLFLALRGLWGIAVAFVRGRPWGGGENR